MRDVASVLRQYTDNTTSLVDSPLISVVACLSLAIASCTLIRDEADQVVAPTERSFESLSDYARWCGQLGPDAPDDYRTHGEMMDAIQHYLDAHLLATPPAEVEEFHHLRTVVVELTVEMWSRHPREGEPYVTIHVADKGGSEYALFANRLEDVYRRLAPDIIETLEADGCVQ